MTRKITKMFMARRRRHMTQALLAGLVGVTQPRISAWESGLVDIPPKRAELIGKAIEVEPDELRDEV